MILNKKYVIQHHRTEDHYNIFNLTRFDYNELFDSLHYPVVWTYDTLLNGYFPTEVDYSFIQFLHSLPDEIDISSISSKGRIQNLKSAYIIPPTSRLDTTALTQFVAGNGYVKIPQLISGDWIKYIYQSYFWRNLRRIISFPESELVKGFKSHHLPLSKYIGRLVENYINNFVNVRVMFDNEQTNAYYKNSEFTETLKSDQTACNLVIAVSDDSRLNSNFTWNFNIKKDETTYTSNLSFGDGVLYFGNTDHHYFEKIVHTQLMMNLELSFKENKNNEY